MAVAAKAAELKASGHDIISLGAGEPDFPTPEFAKEAAKQAIDANFTHYTQVDGILELKEAIINKLSRDNSLIYKPEQIIVSCGAKHGIYNAMQALLNPGDEVLIPTPFWVSYPDMALLADAKPLFINADMQQRFKITPEQLAAAITAKTRLLILNSPSNPSGVAYTKDELAALGGVLLKHPQIVILSDDIYEHTFWADFPFSNILNACPELYDRTLIVNGVSKAYAMTGWRIGYTAGPTNVIKAMCKIQGQSTTNPCSISQKAATAALNGDQSFIKTMNEAFKSRHDYMVQELTALPGIECLTADGAFYVLFKVEGLIKRLNLAKVTNDTELAEYLIHTIGLALVPGSAFGAPGYLRASIAANPKQLEEAIKRLKNLIEKIN